VSQTAPDQARLETERDRIAAQIIELQRAFDEIVAAAEFTSTDDEHDPDGATIGFERAQAAALLERAQHQLADIGDAIARWHDGTYGRCTHCGSNISNERLEALPATRTCVNCAAAQGALFERK
jgi:RNA polymerase-binding transcription factor DksA